MHAEAANTATGFFGKLPWAGDFVQRRLPHDLVQGWDAHACEVLAGAPHLAAGQTPWALLCAPGTCGAAAWAGVVVGGADRVGRRFPLLLARPCGADADAGGLLGGGLAWFVAARALLALLRSGGLADTDAFDAAVVALPAPTVDTEAPTLRRDLAGAAAPAHAAAWRHCLQAGGSMWWRGDALPCVLPGLPDAAACLRALAADAAAEVDA